MYLCCNIYSVPIKVASGLKVEICNKNVNMSALLLATVISLRVNICVQCQLRNPSINSLIRHVVMETGTSDTTSSDFTLSPILSISFSSDRTLTRSGCCFC